MNKQKARVKIVGSGMIIRHKQKGSFTTIPNAIFKDERISIAAKGLLGYLLSLPPNWQVHHKQLQHVLGMGPKLFRRCRDELIAAGYLTCDAQQGRDADNRFTALNYVVSDKSIFSSTGEPPRPEPAPQRRIGNKNKDIKTDLNKSLPYPLVPTTSSDPAASESIYTPMGRRALDQGRHPVFVGSKPFHAWRNVRGPDGMPPYVDSIQKAGRTHQVVWMPSLYPPLRSAFGIAEELIDEE